MPKFRIVGAHRDTGKDVKVLIEADTADEARAKANRRGIVVADCRATAPTPSIPTPATPVEHRHEAAAGAVATVDPDAEPLTRFEIKLRAMPSRIWKAMVLVWRFLAKPRLLKPVPEESEKTPPSPVETSEAPAPPDESSRACPYCAETINAKAIKCRFCGEIVDGKTPTSPSPQPTAAAPPQPDLGQQLGQLFSALVGLGVCIAVIVFVWPYAFSNSKSGTSGSAGTSTSSSSPLPILKVIDATTNLPDSSVSFTGWKVEGYVLSANARLIGQERVASLNYTARRGGSVVGRGYVYVPGDALVRNESVKVNVPVMQEITSDMEVTIEVGH